MKTGVVIEIVLAGNRPLSHKIKMAPFTRDEVSYVVLVGKKTYWPRVSAFKEAK
jgi:hypothetical protein